MSGFSLQASTCARHRPGIFVCLESIQQDICAQRHLLAHIVKASLTAIGLLTKKGHVTERLRQASTTARYCSVCVEHAISTCWFENYEQDNRINTKTAKSYIEYVMDLI